MAIDLIDRTKPHMNVGTVGHSGHGKTTLTAAITKVLAKGNPRIQFRSVDSIVKAANSTGSITHVQYETGAREYDHADCPSRGDCMATMMAGPTQMDGAILVVAGNDGPMPQTRDHLQLVSRMSVPRLVVYLNKCDMLDDPELLSLVELEIRDLITKCGLPGDQVPVVYGSALKALQGDANWEKSITDLMGALDASAV